MAARRAIVATPAAWLVWGTVVAFFIFLAGVIGSVVVSSFGTRWFDTWLPLGWTADWYASLVQDLRGTTARVAVDTSGEPLAALATSLSTAAPHLMKPNGHELASLTGRDGDALEKDPVIKVAASVGNGEARCATWLQPATASAQPSSLVRSAAKKWSRASSTAKARRTSASRDSDLMVEWTVQPSSISWRMRKPAI